MQKSNLIAGIVYVLIGIACLLAAIFTDSRLDSLLCGFAGAGIVPGCVMIYKYLYWTSPENKQKYQERLEEERIELHDELKEKLRDKSGRYAYTLGIVTIAVSIVVFGILGALQVVEGAKVFLLYLGVYGVFQIVAGIVIFKRLLKKY